MTEKRLRAVLIGDVKARIAVYKIDDTDHVLLEERGPDSRWIATRVLAEGRSETRVLTKLMNEYSYALGEYKLDADG